MNRLKYVCALMYWFIFRPKTYGVKCLIMKDDNVLLIRNTYGKGLWNLPGGGIENGETPQQAVIREVKEETGILLIAVHELGSFFTNHQYKRDTVYCFYAEVLSSEVTIDPKEISESRWFVVNGLPHDVSTVVQNILEMRGVK